MNFDKVFLQSQNDDCLGQILSFLTCHDLANVARTCKVLQKTIFETDDEQGNVNLIWQGAEETLTAPRDKQPIYASKRRARVGSNAREHCHLFALASKAAKACELLDGIEENRMMVDGVLANLMNVRGFDAESVAEKKAIGAQQSQIIEEASGNFEFKILKFKDMSDEEKQRKKERALEMESERREKWEKLVQLPEPTKTYHHHVFVRITRIATGEMISEGFCRPKQKLAWHAGLEIYRDFPNFPIAQGLGFDLDFESLNQSEEMQNFCLSCTEEHNNISITDQALGINLTAMVIDSRNHDIQCLFQMLDTRFRMAGPGHGPLHHFTRYDISAQPRWGSDSIQLGPSVEQDLYFLAFSLSLNIAEKIDGSGTLLVPLLEVDVREDLSAKYKAFARHLEA